MFISKKKFELLLATISELKTENAMLRARISELEHRKNSNNSSIPPSKDENRVKRNQSLRERSGKKPGAQPGHQGNMLQTSENPDEIIKYVPQFCNCCGSDLTEVHEEFIENRQELVLPEIKVKCVEHQVYGKKCKCGHITESSFPSDITAKIQYGRGIGSLISYLFARQYIPFQRMTEMLNHLFHIPISEGGIHYLLEKFTIREIPFYNQIRNRLEVSRQAGGDETGADINGKKSWFWTWQNESLTFIVHSLNRGYATIQEYFPKGFANGILNHDRWAAQINTPAKGHQICTAHLLRDLNYLIGLYNCKWAVKLKTLILKSIQLKKQLTIVDYLKDIPERALLENELDELLMEEINIDHKKSRTLQKQLTKLRDSILTFLYYNYVGPDNNGSERAIRNVKVKQKVSGYFKSVKGAEIYAINRSIIDTIIKSGNDVLPSLNLIASSVPD